MGVSLVPFVPVLNVQRVGRGRPSGHWTRRTRFGRAGGRADGNRTGEAEGTGAARDAKTNLSRFRPRRGSDSKGPAV
jgi:hypothetical protein